MNRAEKWAEYRRRRDAVFSACWDCERPCSACCAWAQATAFNRVPTSDFAEACQDTYDAVMRMQERGVPIR